MVSPSSSKESVESSSPSSKPNRLTPLWLDPLRSLEYPVAILCLNVTIFTILWKSVGLSWMPFDLAEHFQAVFTEGYYARDMQRNESQYNLFFFFLYGVLGTAAQIASLRIAQIRRTLNAKPGVWRYPFAVFHVLIAVYHVLFVFQVVKGKLLLDQMAPWQMLASKVLYLLELAMAIELLFVSSSTFFRRKVCLDAVSACNLLPFLIYWGFAITGFNNPSTTRLVESFFFANAPLMLLCIEWTTWRIANSSANSA